MYLLLPPGLLQVETTQDLDGGLKMIKRTLPNRGKRVIRVYTVDQT